MIISWFSAGVSSAVATMIALQKNEVRIIYTHIEDQHPDTIRFINDCSEWFNQDIEIIQSPLKTVNNACLQASYISNLGGAACTRLLKRRVRKEWELENGDDHTYVWGFDYSEKHRADRVVDNMPDNLHLFPLIDNLIDKQSAHGILEKAGIRRPTMYDLGYPNNNCIGCIKGGAGYWRKIREDFPEAYEQRCILEEKIGYTIIKGCSLRELPSDAGRDLKIIVPDCGLFCDIPE